MEREHARRLLQSALADAHNLQAVERSWLRPGGDGSADVHPVDQHQADAASDLYQREADTAILLGEQHRALEILDALERVEAGSYGRCATCGEPLPDERLEAVPATRWCVRHELQHELAVLERPGSASPLVVLPGDDDLADDVVFSPEEGALHIESASRSLTPEAFERYEAAGDD